MDLITTVISLPVWQIVCIGLAVISVAVSIIFFVHRLFRRHAIKSLVNLAGFAYDPKQNIFYSQMDAWQRKFGYCRLYDEEAPLTNMIIDSEPIHFRYKRKNWLIEFWKGQYGMTTGAEVGIYYTRWPVGRSEKARKNAFYHCVKNKDMLPMTCRLIKDKRTVFYRQGRHWWLTGFVLGEFSEPYELTLQVSLDFPDQGMMQAFIAALRELGYECNRLSSNGNTVCVNFTHPLSEQPSTRSRRREKEAQAMNRKLCEAFGELTGRQADVRDRLRACRRSNPALYQKAVRFGKTPGTFDRKTRKVVRMSNE